MKTQGTLIPNQPLLPWASLQPGQGGCWEDARSGGYLPHSILLLTWEHLRAAQASILPAWQLPIRGGLTITLETPIAITAVDGCTEKADGGRRGQPQLVGRDRGLLRALRGATA